MKHNNFWKVADIIEKKLSNKGWSTVDRTAGLLIFRALDTADGVRHELIFDHPFKDIEFSGDPWVGIGCDAQILFENLEKKISEKLNREYISNVSVIFNLAQMAPESLFYLRSVFPINVGSAESMEKGVDDLLSIYYEFVEPQRKAVVSEECFDAPGYYPPDPISPLIWELRRAARYSMTKTKEEYNIYANNLMRGVDDYAEGLGDEQSLPADTARRTISEIRQFVENSRKEI